MGKPDIITDACHEMRRIYMAPHSNDSPRQRSDATLRQALAYQQSGRVQEALQLYEQVLAAAPNHPSALNFAGTAHFQLGHGEQAVELLQRATLAAPGYADAYRNLGIVLREMGNPEQAAAALQRVVELVPGDVEGYNAFGIVLRRLGRLENAAAVYARALEIQPDYAQAHANLGNVLVDQDRLDEAVASYRRALAMDPALASVHRMLGTALQRQGLLDEAISSYRHALAAKPDYVLAYTNLGSALVEKGEPAEGAECFRRALQLNPRAADTHVMLGIALHDLGDLNAALKCCDTSLELASGNSYALAYKSIMLHDLGQHEALRKLVDLDRLIQRVNLPTPSGYSSLAQFNAALADYARSHPSLQRGSIRHRTQTAELFIEADGLMVTLKQMVSDAVKAYGRSLPIDPTHPFLSKPAPQRFRLHGWANVLDDKGADAHVHPSGWISGVYYVSMPGAVTDAAHEHAGWIEFGRPEPRYYSARDYEVRTVQPTTGLMLLFPSYFWHRILPFAGSETRISYAFDVIALS
jgi:tetratricopeptide (TPR) repeat protein